MNQQSVTGPLNLMRAKAQEAWQGFFYQLPNIISALIFLILAWYASKLLGRAIAALARSRGRPDLGNVLGTLARGGMLILAVLFAAAIVFPSVKPGDVFATLGIGSVAIGFAFKDILQNMLAGLLLLIRRPYRRGDQIVVKDFEGTVEQIESRATLIKTYDGRQVIIPNSDIYTSPVIVNTAYPSRRDEYVVGVGYGDEAADAARIFVEVMKSVEGVLSDPAPEALPWQLSDSTVDLKLRWWADSLRTEQVHVRARVILAVFEAAREHCIDLPFPTTVMLFHDQTEEVDGNRTQQREGWPAGKSPPKPRRSTAPSGNKDSRLKGNLDD